MADRRYTFEGFPGPSVTISFRIPEAASLLLEERVAELKAAGEIRDRTQALQDALVKWLMLEELARHKAPVQVASDGQAT